MLLNIDFSIADSPESPDHSAHDSGDSEPCRMFYPRENLTLQLFFTSSGSAGAERRRTRSGGGIGRNGGKPRRPRRRRASRSRTTTDDVFWIPLSCRSNTTAAVRSAGRVRPSPVWTTRVPSAARSRRSRPIWGALAVAPRYRCVRCQTLKQQRASSLGRVDLCREMSEAAPCRVPRRPPYQV